jgi:hypothetical protein
VVGGGAGAAPATITTGTGVVTALGVNTGTAGAFVVNGGALGTPSSGTVTNLTGTASININGTVGATTATTGKFTTVQAATTMGVGGTTPSASGAGISFPATQSASTDANTLDDYEEGTWTPSVGGTATYTTQAGRYTKIGNIVYIQGQINILLLLTGSASTLSGLPFSAASGSSEGGFNVTYFSGLAVNVIQPVLGVDGSTSSCTVYSRTTAGTGSSAVSVFGNGARLFFYGHYQI